MKVKLEPIGEGPYIKAPEFCPFKTDWIEPRISTIDTRVGPISCPVNQHLGYQVNSSLCPLCKLCDFIVEDVETACLTRQEQHFFAEYLTTHPRLSNSILAQNQFLAKNGRIPLVVLISFTVLQDMVHTCIVLEDRRQKILTFLLQQEQPICFILGCPVYFSRKLTKSPVQVAGEIEWK